jgi:Na+-translocating ferredoxin:NAD+ oxidoreductase RnfG subunit
MSIARFTTTLACSLLAAQLASGVAAAACPNPNRDKPHELTFKVKDDKVDGCVVEVKKKDGTSGNEITVCENDTVQWKVKGNAKMIVFVAETPFVWAASDFERDKIEGKVKPGTKGKEFKYSVYVKDTVCVFDPKIIVEP